MERYVMKGDRERGRLKRYHLILGITNRCRLRCRQCYVEGLRKPSEAIDLGTAKRAVREFARIAEAESQERGIVNIKGGEPFDSPGRTKEIAMLSASLGMEVFITTNGIGVVSSIGMLERIHDASEGRLRMVLSLNGRDAETDALLRVERAHFDRTVAAARALAGSGIGFDINHIVHEGNLEGLDGMVRLARDLGASQLNVLQLILSPKATREGLAKADANRMLEALNGIYDRGDTRTRELLEGSLADALSRMRAGEYGKGCVAGFRGLLYIAPDGSAFSCPSTACGDYRAGDIRESSVGQLMDSAALKRLRMLDIGPGCKGDLMSGGRDAEELSKAMERIIGKGDTQGSTSICIQKNF
jgi:MoaA/NifB/PqqE/SkfB family radical SAM enzyme